MLNIRFVSFYFDSFHFISLETKQFLSIDYDTEINAFPFKFIFHIKHFITQFNQEKKKKKWSLIYRQETLEWFQNPQKSTKKLLLTFILAKNKAVARVRISCLTSDFYFAVKRR